MVGLHPETIRNILIQMKITLRPPHITNCLYIPTSHKDSTHHQMLQKIKMMYEDDKISATKIAEILKIDSSTVRNKLKAMQIPLRQNHGKVMPGGYKCQWCAKVMEFVYHNSGPRKQLYCDSRCGNKAKDYRRMKKNIKFSSTRLVAMESFLKDAWKADYETAVKNIMDVKIPIEISKKTNTYRQITKYRTLKIYNR